MTKILFFDLANIKWDAAKCSFHCKKFRLKHSRIIAEMNGFSCNVIMTVVDKHTCSSPVVIKRGAIC